MLKGLGAINQLRNRKGGRGGHQKDYTLITDYAGAGAGGRPAYMRREKINYDKFYCHNLYLYI